MPRIARNQVQFEVDNRTYAASFSHVHNDPPSVMGYPGVKGKIRHVTLCYLTKDETGIHRRIGEGRAICYHQDAYNWRTGIKMSLERALTDAGIAENGKEWGQFHRAFFDEMSKRPNAQN